MPLPPSSRIALAPGLDICRVLNGMWQVSGAHGPIDPTRAVGAMTAYHDAGFTTWDLADHYGPAEDFIGRFRRLFADRYGRERLGEIQALTKWVPPPGAMTRRIVEEAVGVSLSRMGVDCLDLLQFHWWDYGDRRYLDALRHLADLHDEGKIRHLALTNFDTERLGVIADDGIAIVSNQVQFSLVDRRPEAKMAGFCAQHGIGLLAYGTLLGGLLSEKYLGRPEPARPELATASLQKYKHMIDAWGGWALFQELLATLKAIADRHGVSIANVGVRWVLDRPAAAGVIVGARLGVAEHIADNARVFGLALGPDESRGDRRGLREIARPDAADRRLRRRVPPVMGELPCRPQPRPGRR
jgi:aryl-alcohol dehydrogenase-like predicted oxidoreductase